MFEAKNTIIKRNRKEERKNNNDKELIYILFSSIDEKNQKYKLIFNFL